MDAFYMSQRNNVASTQHTNVTSFSAQPFTVLVCRRPWTRLQTPAHAH